MSLHLHGMESLFKSMNNATMQLHLLFWSQAVLSESSKHSNNLKISFFFIQKSVKRCNISLVFLVMQTLYINNVFTTLIEQYFNDTFGSILKLCQGF